ncbi:hypothetical protein SCFA_220101 [anaerobic digester metagenome]|uniref:Uncharacterized protein n=1 Tax=anaerobic digester metagenome TaxID=1263854 RepID=A0A485M0W3_9ZZZZ
MGRTLSYRLAALNTRPFLALVRPFLCRARKGCSLKRAYQRRFRDIAKYMNLDLPF